MQHLNILYRPGTTKSQRQDGLVVAYLGSSSGNSLPSIGRFKTRSPWACSNQLAWLLLAPFLPSSPGVQGCSVVRQPRAGPRLRSVARVFRFASAFQGCFPRPSVLLHVFSGSAAGLWAPGDKVHGSLSRAGALSFLGSSQVRYSRWVLPSCPATEPREMLLSPAPFISQSVQPCPARRDPHGPQTHHSGALYICVYETSLSILYMVYKTKFAGQVQVVASSSIRATRSTGTMFRRRAGSTTTWLCVHTIVADTLLTRNSSAFHSSLDSLRVPTRIPVSLYNKLCQAELPTDDPQPLHRPRWFQSAPASLLVSAPTRSPSPCPRLVRFARYAPLPRSPGSSELYYVTHP